MRDFRPEDTSMHGLFAYGFLQIILTTVSYALASKHVIAPNLSSETKSAAGMEGCVRECLFALHIFLCTQPLKGLV